MSRVRLTAREISLLRYLARVSGFVKLSKPSRELIVPMWRRGIVNCLYRQEPDHKRGLQGPFFQLTALGQRLAQSFITSDPAAQEKSRHLSSHAKRAPSLQPGELT